MRNVLLPKRLAEYVTASQLRKLGMADAVFERDPTFGSAQLETSTKDVEEVETPMSVEVDLLKVR
jgi:Ribosomal protein L9, N-terminal domain